MGKGAGRTEIQSTWMSGIVFVASRKCCVGNKGMSVEGYC